VAVKVLRPELAAVVGADRFLHEIQVTANLQHPHILPLFESGEAGGFLYYVMPFVEGESLRDRLRREGQLPTSEVARLLGQIADALGYAHARGVLHRDIKPDNVMMSGRHATVMDFGVARAVTEAADQAALTMEGVAIGTPAYMAPEQAAADPQIDHRADIYALGLLGYELLTGSTPFADRSPQQVLVAQMTEEPEPVTTRRREVPAVLAEVVMRSLEKDMTNRWSTGEEIVRRLESLNTSDSTTAPSVASRGIGRHMIAGLVGLAAIIVILLTVLGRGADPTAGASSTSTAIFPFTVRGGAELDYLGEGMVGLLARSLDGAGDLRSVDSRAVLAAIRHEQPGLLDPESAGDLAQRLGAGLYVLGDIVQVGASVHIDAALYDRQGATDPIGQASVDGGPDDLLSMVNQVAAQLLASGVAPASRVVQVAAVTTDSLSALKAYLEGEQLFRVGQYDPAVEAFQNAIAVDSQFALAFYRLSVAAEWALNPGLARVAAEGAVRHAERLAEHDRRLLDALLATRNGEGERAERLFRSIVQVWPQDVEAWNQLGEAQFHFGPLSGRAVERSRVAFERVLSFEPDHAGALVHLNRMATRLADSLGVDTLARLIETLNPAGDRTFETDLSRALVLNDAGRIDQLLQRLPSVPEVYMPQATWGVLIWSDYFEEVQPFLDVMMAEGRSTELRALAHVHRAYTRLVQGRREEAQRDIAFAETLDQALGLTHRALVTLHPFVQASAAELEALIVDLTGWDAAAVPPNSMTTAHFNIHDGLYPAIRIYLLGLARARLGQLEAAAQTSERLLQLGGNVDAVRIQQALSLGIDANIALSRGDSAEALRILERHEPIGHFEIAMFSAVAARTSDRFLQAILLEGAGRSQEAAAVYRSFENFNLTDRPYAAPSYLRLGRMVEHEGRTDEAGAAYERLLLLWSNADPQFQPMVAEATEALQRLR
jgi:tetratricopeptide (TPR) repeat protein